ncbi:hypothetical protein HID58_039925 [Brassica napus]|uniref:Uncharacterized protein n=1 Tax=Brassica napus TaxID=3708 RepID=A0ABQ8B6K1_BRANA|nr:hypothetical protein HID58_039925 [Brassica napus]
MKSLIHAVWLWVRRQPPKVKAFLAVVTGMAALVVLRFIVHDHDNLFVAAEAVIWYWTRGEDCWWHIGIWIVSMVLISEVVQTFILADFCYYYVKSVFGGQLVLRLPSGVV